MPRDMVDLMKEMAGAEEEAELPIQAPGTDPLSQTFNLATRSIAARDDSDDLVDEMQEAAGVKPDLSSGEQFFGGAVDRIAATIGVTPDLIAAMLQRGGNNLEAATPRDKAVAELDAPTVGMSPDEIQGSLETQSDIAHRAVKPDQRVVTQALRDAAEAVGLPANVGDSFIAQVGGDTATGLMIVASLAATKGRLAKYGTPSAGAGYAERFGRFIPRQLAKIGQSAAARPGAAVAAEIGAATGANAFEDQGIVGSIVGGVAGAYGGQSVANLGRGVVGGVEKQLARIGGRTAPEAPPLVTEGVDPGQTALAAEAYIGRERNAIDNTIQSVLDNNQPRVKSRTGHGAVVDSLEAQERLATSLDEAQEKASKVVGKAWKDAVPKTYRVETGPLKDSLSNLSVALKRGFVGDDFDIPNRYIQIIEGMKPAERAGLLLNLRSQLMDDIRLAKASGGTRLSKTTRMNLQKIVDRIENHIATNLPDATLTQKGVTPSPKLLAAQALSTRYHDLFTRSAVGDALASARSGGPRLNPAEMLDALGKEMGTGTVLKDIDGFLKAQGVTKVPEVQRRFEEALMTTWREQSKGMGGEISVSAAEALMRRVRPSIQKSLPIYGQLMASTEELGRQLALKAELDRGVAAKFIGHNSITGSREPQKAIADLFSAGSPPDYAQQLMKAMGNDPDAITGIRNLAIGEFFRKFGGSAPRLQTELAGPNGRALARMLSPEQFAELNKIVKIGAQVESGDVKTVAWATKNLFVLFARFFGAGFGRYTSKLTGAGTVQQPGMLAEAFRNVAEGLVGEMPVNELMAAAVLDPKWRKVLYAKIPTDDKSARALLRTMRYGLGVMNAGQREVQSRLESEE